MFRAAFDAALAVHAVWIVEDAVPCRIGREESEGACLCAQSAFDTGCGYADASLVGVDCLVYLPHRTDRTPEIAVENQPADESDRGRDGNHDVQEHSPPPKCGRSQPDDQPREHRNHHEDRRLAFQEAGGDVSPRVWQQRVECPAWAEVAASVASSVAHRTEKAHCHVDKQAIRKIGIAPSQCQNRHEKQCLNMAFHSSEVQF